MDAKELQKRTKIFAIRIIKLVQYFNDHGPETAKILGNRQLLRSGTGVASGYRAACRSKSRKDFISKMGTVVEEADETQLWLELLVESGLVKIEKVQDLLDEAGQLTAIMTSARNTAIQNQESDKYTVS
jgi:four helix bundle protein